MEIDKLDVIEHIMECGEIWVIDYLPKRCDNAKLVNELEEKCYRKHKKKKYVQQILNIFLKLILCYDSLMWVGETRKIFLKKYSNCMLGNEIKIDVKMHVIQSMLMSEQTLTVLLEPINAVVDLGLYNSAIYFTNNDEKEYFEKIVESEGLFLRKVSEDS